VHPGTRVAVTGHPVTAMTRVGAASAAAKGERLMLR
jgi:hypothetical protein